MENLNLPPFYPGQKVVALRDAVGISCKKGDILTVAGCIKSPCNCSKTGWEVAIKEFPGTSGITKCICGKKTINHKHLIYLIGSAQYFAPLEEKFEHISLSKVIEIETCLVSEN